MYSFAAHGCALFQLEYNFVSQTSPLLATIDLAPTLHALLCYMKDILQPVANHVQFRLTLIPRKLSLCEILQSLKECGQVRGCMRPCNGLKSLCTQADPLKAIGRCCCMHGWFQA